MFSLKRSSATFLFVFLYLAAGLWPAVAQADNHNSVAVVFSSDRPPYFEAWDGFQDYLEESGISFSFHRYRLNRDDRRTILREIKEREPDLVVTIGSKATQMAKESIHDIPVIFCMVLNVKAFSAPNITGVPIDVPFSRKLQIINSILPGIEKIGVIYRPEDAGQYAGLTGTAESSGLELMKREVASAKELTEAIDEMFWRINAFFILPIPSLYFPQSVRYIIQEGLRKKMPVVGLSSAYTRAGSLISFQYEYGDLGREAAKLAALIFQGQDLGTLQPSRPSEVQYSLNLDVARKIGLKLSGSSISEAAEIFPQ